jgi:hypothetical protein
MTGNSEFNGHPCQRITIGQSLIYFPTDGYQPRSEEVVEWCGANIENRSITRWFMEMYGLEPYNGSFLKNGFDEYGNATAIIKFGETMKSREQLYLDNFEQMAANPAGRVTLYLLLLEIRRQKRDATGRLAGCLQQNLGQEQKEIPISEKNLETRNRCRSITVEWGNKLVSKLNKNVNYFSYFKKTIGFFIGYGAEEVKTTVIQGSEILSHPRPDHVGMFHEVLHWFHFLRDTERYFRNAGLFQIDENESYIMNEYLRNPNDSEIIKEALEYWSLTGRGNLEEIRTICGTDKDEYDGVSENLYRWCLGEPLRYGYVAKIETKPKAKSKLSQEKIKSSVENVSKTCKKAAAKGGYRTMIKRD